jgi:hypothetical protein
VAPLSARKEEKKLPTLTDLLPKELEPISPESDTLKEKDDSDEDGEVGFADGKEEEDSSPPFEPIEEVNSHLGESSGDSPVSGISELTSHESQHSHISFIISNHANNNNSPTKMPPLDLSNNDSQLSKVSSSSRLSVVSLYEQDCRLTHNTEINDDSEQSKTSLPVSGQDTLMSASIEFTDEENEMKYRDVYVTGDNSCEESSIYTNRLKVSTHNSSHSISDGITTGEKTLRPEIDEEESSQDERSETKIDTRFEKVCEDTPEKKLIEECDHKNYVFGYKSDESEDKIMVDKYESEHDVSNNMISNEEFEEKWEEKIDEKSDELTGEKSEERTDEKCDKNVEAQYECKFEEISVKKESEKTERITDDKHEGEVEEKYEMRQDEHLEKKLDEKSERRLEERSESKSEEKSERKLDEKCDRKVYEKSTRRLDEKHEKKTNDKLERKLGEKTERKYDEKSDVRCDEKYERKSVDRYERKSDEKSERKHDEHLEHKLDERTERKSDEMSEKKSDEKLVRKLDEKPLRKTDEKSDKKLVEKSEKKLDINLEKKTDDKSDRKSDTKCEKKVDDKHDKKQDRHKEDRERSREKKDEKKWLSIESKDIKKSDNSGHSSEVDRKRSDKDKHKKERGDSRSKAEKSSKDGKEKTEKDGGKEKVQHEEKTEREIMKEKSKQGVKENKDEKRSDEKEKKVEKDSSKEKCKKEDGDVLRHEKDSKKSKSDEKKERDRKEKPKSEEKVQMKHDDRHKERTKSESRDKSDKDKTARHDDRNSKDGSRSSSKESKDRIKQETKDKGKGTTIKSEEKKSKGKSKYEEKSSKAAGKGSIKKMDKKTVESETHKSSHTDHKSKNSGKKGKENKGKSITDDHRIHRDKHSDDRRSTDRDSNGTAHSRSVGSTTSRTNGNDSQHSQSRCDKSGSSSNSSKSDSGGNSESSTTIESSKNVEENIPSASKSSSPPSSLPFKKRPLSIQSEDEHESVDGESRELSYSKIKKPKIAANIFEVKKIMMLRKSLAKKERKQQRELKRNESPSEKVKEVRSEKKMSKPVVAKRRKLGDVEKSLRKEVDTSLSKKQMPEVESDKEGGSAGLKYFYSELNPSVLSHAESDFLAYVKRLVESDNLSEISTSSDPDSEMSDMDDIIQLPSYYLDDVVAAELGAKILKTGRGTEIVLNLPEDEELSKRSLPSLHSTTDDSFPVANKSSTAVDPFSVIASPGQAVLLTNPRDSNMRHSVGERMDLRPMSVQSSSSDTSAEDMILSDRNVKRILRRQYSSSGASTNSSQSTSEKIDVASNGLDTGRIPDSGSKIQKKSMFSRKKVKKEISFIPEMKPPELAVEKRDLRRSRKPSTRYSDKMFASYLEDEDLSHDAFSEERDNIKLDDESPVVACNVSKNVPGRANSTYPISVGGNKICFAATITQADDDSSDRENMSEPLTGDRYDIIKDNNNIDKGSSEDERGCTDGSMLNQDLILPTLRDLMVESGFRTEDDKSDILPSLVGIGKTVGNSLSMTGNNVHNVTLTVRGAHETSEETETKRPNLGRSRRVGLGRPHPKRSSGQAGDDDTGNRMPPSSNTADFVMPLSPESDVSASSGEARKSVLDSKGKVLSCFHTLLSSLLCCIAFYSYSST